MKIEVFALLLTLLTLVNIFVFTRYLISVQRESKRQLKYAQRNPNMNTMKSINNELMDTNRYLRRSMSKLSTELKNTEFMNKALTDVLIEKDTEIEKVKRERAIYRKKVQVRDVIINTMDNKHKRLPMDK